MLIALLIPASYANTAPSISSFNLTPTTVKTNQNISTMVASTDAEGDSVTYTYNWYINGVSALILNHPFTNATQFGDSQTTIEFSGYNLHGQLGNTTVNDSNQPNATTSCKIGTCYVFDGINDYIQVNQTAILNFSSTDSFSISAWFKTPYIRTSTNLLSKGNPDSAPGYEIETDWSTDALTFGIRGGSNSATASIANSSATPILDNNWHQVFAVRDVASDQIFIYIDGVFKDAAADATAGSVGSTDNLIIGASRTLDSNWNGSIDEVRIYNRSLSAEEIYAVYLAENNGFGNNITTQMGLFAGQVWNATVVPIDLYGLNGTPTWSSNTITIAALTNNAPTISSLNLTPASPRTNQNLSTMVASTDADSDSITHAYTWYKNGTATMHLNLPFNNPIFSADEAIIPEYSGLMHSVRAGYAGLGDPMEPNLSNGTCKIGYCYTFDGINDFINVSQNASLNFSSTDSFSISAWFKTPYIRTGTNLLSKGNPDSAPGYELETDSSTDALDFTIRGGSNAATASIANSSATPIFDNNWHQVFAVRDVGSDQIFIYIDGIFKSSAADTTTGDIGSDEDLIIGASNSLSGNWNGSIDEVRMYNRSLSAEEILAIYTAENNGFGNNITTQTGIFVGQVWNATVVPIDAQGMNGTPTWSGNTLTINNTGNNAPAISSFNLTPASPRTNQNLSTVVVSTDVNGDSVTYTYTWYINGTATMHLNLPFNNPIFSADEAIIPEYSGLM
ncbi:MAG: LamG domain-containing protein, partial [Thaumarchaeota archaeon]|nr:LamG domain-containing protein [Nitrososphaerota archaeon]